MKLRTVPAATGFEWIRLGVRTFFRQPLAMSGLFFMFMAAVSVLALIPFLGTALSALLTPAINLGLMSATREASAGRFPMPNQLLTAFRGSPTATRGMFSLGGLYGLGLMLLLLVAGLIDSAVVDPVAPQDLSPADAMRLALGSPALWIALVLMLPLQMLFWHAPALLFWHGVPPIKSLFFSALAIWANKGALLLFLIGWTGLFALLGAALSMIVVAFGGPEAASVVMYPAVLLVASMFFTSIWFTVRDSYLGLEEQAPPSDNPPPLA